eukprot:gene2777-12654_t
MVSQSDVMHYESRAIRDALKASNSRLSSAKVHVPSNLIAEQYVERHGRRRAELDWIQPCVQVSLEDDTLASGDPKYESMLKILFDFENSRPASETDEDQRKIRIGAAHYWFQKNRPGPSGEDPSISAALAASLSLTNPKAGGNHGMCPCLSILGGRPGSGRISPQRAQSGALSMSGSELGGGKGTKHEFFALYSQSQSTPNPVHSNGNSLLTMRPGDVGQGTGSPTRKSGRGPTSSSNTRSSVQDVPIVWHPSVSGVGASTGAARSAAASSFKQAFAFKNKPVSPLPSSLTGSRSLRSAGCDSPDRPGSMERARGVIFDPYNTSAGPGARAEHGESALAGVNSWNLSQTEPTVSTQAEKAKIRAEELESEQREIAAIRLKWTTIDQQIKAADANVSAQIHQWSTSRARLEEEIIRRQEASRFAAPAAKAHPNLQGHGHQAGGLTVLGSIAATLKVLGRASQSAVTKS